MTVLEILIFISNVMGSYRNFWIFSNFVKCVIVTRIIAELLITISFDSYNITVIYSRTGSPIDADNFILYISEILVVLKTVIVLLGSVLHSESYRLYFENFQIIYNRWKGEPSYMKSEKLLKIKCFVSAIILIALVIFIWINGIRDFSSLDYWVFVMEKSHLAWIETRFMLELMVAYCSINGIHEFLRILNSSVSKVLKYYEGKESIQIFPGKEESYQISEIVNTWRELYQHNLACAEHISHSLCELLTFALFALLMQCVTTMYSVVTIIISKVEGKYLQMNSLVFLLSYRAVAYVLLFIAGQKVQNEFSSLNQSLASLSNAVSSHFHKSELRQLKDLYRLVNTSPTVIQFSKLSLGMCLLPMMLSLAATYIVVMLQINHVL